MSYDLPTCPHSKKIPEEDFCLSCYELMVDITRQHKVAEMWRASLEGAAVDVEEELDDYDW